MRLKKAQKEATLRWLAEGLQSDEINERAAQFDPPFEVSRRQATWYRKTRDADIKAITKAGEQEALTQGLALKGERVKLLKQLAALLAKDIFGGFLWVDQIKSIGSGEASEVVEYEEFNRGEVAELRATLDDIAKEVGGRITRTEHSGPGGGPIQHEEIGINAQQRNRALSALADAIAGAIHPDGGER